MLMQNGRIGPNPNHNAGVIGKDRSARTAPVLHPLLAPAVVIAGVAVMNVVARHVGGLGLRPGLVVSEVSLAAPGLLTLVLLGVPLSSGLGLGTIDRRTAALALAAGASLWAASLGLFELQYALWRPPEGYLDAFRRLHGALRPSGPVDAVLSVLAIAVAPAICEELLFRGVVLTSFVGAMGAGAATVASALLFGLIHVDPVGSGSVSLYRVPFAFAVGIGLATLRLRTGSLVPSTLAHGVLNAITFVAAPLADDPSQALPDPRPGLGAALLLVGGVASLLLLHWLRPLTPSGKRA